MSEANRNSIRKRLKPEEWEIIKGIREACDENNVTIRDVKDGWLKSKSASLRFVNPHFQGDKEFTIKDLDLDSVSKSVTPIELPALSKGVGLFDRLVFTDVHIGMEPNPDGYSLYGGKWDKQTILSRLDTMIKWTLKHKKSDTLYIDELGDFMDGWDGQTVRKGHDLPQNMSNQEAFDLGVEFKKTLIERLAPEYNHIRLNNICSDNHAGSFGYVVNSAVKTYLDARFGDRVKTVNQRKFIDHYVACNSSKTYVFVLTHGKDEKNLKVGFKPVLDNRHKTKIENWIAENRLNSPEMVVEFSKGDSHQYIFDNASSDRFNYYNYPAFSPSSDWVQTNFQKGRSGFVHFNYYDGYKTINEHFFEWE